MKRRPFSYLPSMFQFVFFVFLFATSTRLVDGLVCATKCDYSSNINTPIVPSCDVVDRPNAEQSCQVTVIINYVSGDIIARLDARTPAKAFTLDMVTAFSLYDEASSLSIEFDCSTTDQCDILFFKDLLAGNWTKVQSQVKNLRTILADLLFNSTDLRPTETCPSNQPCSGQGFCSIFYQAWSDAERPVLQSTCANSTAQPHIDWVQAYDQIRIGQLMDYTCNEPECASSTTTDAVIRLIERDYILPLNVTIPAQTTTASTQQPTASSSSTTKSAGRSVHLDKSEKMLFAFIFLLFVCLF